MAEYGQVLAVLRDYRNALAEGTQEEIEKQFAGFGEGVQAFMAQGGVSAFTTPLSNVHATGVGVRVRGGKVEQGNFVIKVYVYDKQDLGADTPALTQRFGDVEVDVEHLPIQHALAAVAPIAAASTIPNRDRRRPVIGGLSISPANQAFVGTLGCFVRRLAGGAEQTFALSNNHVLADVNRLPIGTNIVQPGPEVGPTNPGDIFAALSAFIPINFPPSASTPVINRFDAAIAVVSDLSLIRRGQMFGISNYTPKLLAAKPGMRVTKSGRTTGVTTGTVTAVTVNGTKVNYGTVAVPHITTFNETIQIIGDNGLPFSAPGDSGSVILERETGRPVALLFAGDARTTTACDFGGVCRQFQVLPV